MHRTTSKGPYERHSRQREKTGPVYKAYGTLADSFNQSPVLGLWLTSLASKYGSIKV